MIMIVFFLFLYLNVKFYVAKLLVQMKLEVHL